MFPCRLICCCLLALGLAAEEGGLYRIVDGTPTPCPLLAATYTSTISQHVAQTSLRLRYGNPGQSACDMSFVFPLPHTAAVHAMSLTSGDQRYAARMLPSDAAHALYEQARQAGGQAALLVQNRPNIFTQSIANVPAHGEVIVEISLIDELPLRDGAYRFHLPLSIGPRYMPADGSVTDAAAIPQEQAGPAGHQRFAVSADIQVFGALPIAGIETPQQAFTSTVISPHHHRLTWTSTDNSSGDDLMLQIRYADQDQPQAGALIHQLPAEQAAYALVHIRPGTTTQEQPRLPRDWCLVVDTSGSMRGEPIAQCLAVTEHLIDQAQAGDRLQLITFAGNSTVHFDGYQAVDAALKQRCHDILSTTSSGGGTEMLTAIRASMAEPTSDRQQIVMLLTDGYIGNEDAIAAHISEHSSANQRFIALGIGSRVNRHLIDTVANTGGGFAQVIDLQADAAAQADRLIAQLAAPQLTDIRIDWGGAPVADQQPTNCPPLFNGLPLSIACRIDGSGSWPVTVTGRQGDQERRWQLTLTSDGPAQPGLQQLWARKHADQLDLAWIRARNEANKAAIIEHACSYAIMSRFTSFIAVDDEQWRIWREANPDLPTAIATLKTAAPPFVRGQAVADAEAGGQAAFMAIGAGGGANGAFGQRNGGGKKRAIGRHGGSRSSESAVNTGLAKLANQALDANPGSCGITTLSLLGAGYNHKAPSRYRQAVEERIQHLLAMTRDHQGLYSQRLTDHSLATMALIEAYGMTLDPALKQPASERLAALVGQQLTDGSWPATAGASATDLRTTTYGILCLKSAVACGLEARAALAQSKPWVETQLGTCNPTGDPQVLGDIQLCAVLSQVTAADPVLTAIRAAQLQDIPALIASLDDETIWIWSMALFQQGGESWTAWNAIARDHLIRRVMAEPSPAYAVYALEIYYAYIRPQK